MAGLILRALRETDVEEIVLQMNQRHMRELIDAEYKRTAAKSPISFTLVDADHVLGCGGIVKYWDGVGEAWTLLSDYAGQNMLTITRIVKQVLNDAPFHRVQMTTDEGFTEAERWARMLGFEYEGLMRGYLKDGRNAKLWARVR